MNAHRLPAVLLLSVSLLAASCASGGSNDRTTALEERMALVEGRTADLETDQSVAGTPPPDQGDAVAGDADPEVVNAKADLITGLDATTIQDEIVADGEVDVEVVDLELKTDIDLVVATIRPIDGSEADVAWESAKALAPLWAALGAYGPALDLQVGETRCICSSELMKGIANQSINRDGWSGACST